MATHKGKTLLGLMLLLLLVGCATINSPTPGDGTPFEVRGHSYAAVWSAAVHTLERRDLVIVIADREAGVLRSESRADQNRWSSGEVIGIFIRPTRPDAERYVVEVHSLKRSRVQLTGPDWTQSIITGMKADLGEANQR
jgi:hypothetical protein